MVLQRCIGVFSSSPEHRAKLSTCVDGSTWRRKGRGSLVLFHFSSDRAFFRVQFENSVVEYFAICEVN